MSDPIPQPSNAEHRNRSIRLAVVTSLVSKVGTIVLRLVSIPIAIKLLDLKLFGVYTSITMVVGLLDIFHVGIGPALTRELSKAVANGDRDRESSVFATSILISTGLTVLMTLIAVFLLLNIPIPTLFGEKFEPVAEIMLPALFLGLIIIGIEVICIPFEMARDGYLETRYSNSWGAVGNILGAILLVSGIWYFRSIEFLLLAVNGSIAFAKLGNAIQLLIQRPYLFPRFSLFRLAMVPSLSLNSLRFSVTYMMAAAVEYNLMSFLIGRVVGPSAVGIYNVMITVHFSLTGLIVMFTRPIWPAIMDAHERNDTPWIKQTSKRLCAGGVGFALIAGIGLVGLGPWVLPMWAGDEFKTAVPGFEMDRVALAAFSFYFAAHLWRHINQTLALGVGRINPVVFTVVAEAVFLVTATWIILNHTRQIEKVYLAMAVSLCLFSAWLLPLIFRKGLQQLAESDKR